MPRVKLIYVGNGEWIEPVADYRKCSHPRNVLRFDSRFSVPSYKYCTNCGQAWIPPFWGLTEEEIADLKKRGEELARKLGFGEE